MQMHVYLCIVCVIAMYWGNQCMANEDPDTLSAQQDQPKEIQKRSTKNKVPSVPRITHISNNQATSFYVHWESPKTINGKLIKYKIRWKEGHSSSSKSREIVGHLTNPMTVYINDLKPYSSYRVQVAAATRHGYGDFSPEYPVLTEVAAPSAPRNLNATMANMTSCHLEWDTPDVVYRRVIFYSISIWDDQMGDRVLVPISGNLNEFTMTGLKEGLVYWVEVAGVTAKVFHDSKLIGDYSQAVQCSAPAEVPSVPRNIRIDNIKGTSFYVHWESPANGWLVKYKVQWRETNSSITEAREISGQLTNPMVAYIHDLKPYTEYLVEVAAASAHGYGDFTALTALTDTEAPSAPLNLRVTPKNETSVHLEWDIPLMVYGRLDNYLVNFLDRSGDRVRITIPGGNLTEHTHTTTELRPLEFYDVKLAGITKSISTDTAYVGDFSQSVRTVLGDTSSLLLNLYEKMDILEQRFNQASNEAANSVVFYASLIENAFFEEGRAILFDDAMVNQGNAYHEETGVFTAPVHGVYAFQLSARLFGKDGEVVLAIVVRDTAEAKLRLDTESKEPFPKW